MGVVAFITSVTQGQAVGLEDKNETGQELRVSFCKYLRRIYCATLF